MKTTTKLCARIGLLCLLAMLDGMVDCCMGPALRDLQCIFSVTLQEVSLFQPVITAGRVTGSLLFLKIPGRVNVYGAAAATMTMASCLLAVVPVLPSFWMALGLSGAAGLAHGSALHARILLSGELSKQHVAAIHITNLATALGCITGPLIISPFLLDSVGESNTGQAFHHGNMTFRAQNKTEPVFHHGKVTFTAQNISRKGVHHGNTTFTVQNISRKVVRHGNTTFTAQNISRKGANHGNTTFTVQNISMKVVNRGNMTFTAQNISMKVVNRGNMTFTAQNKSRKGAHHGNVTYAAQNISRKVVHHGNVTYTAQNISRKVVHHGNVTYTAQNISRKGAHRGDMTFTARNSSRKVVHHDSTTCTSQNSTQSSVHQDYVTSVAQSRTSELKDHLCSNVNSDLIYGFLLIALFGVTVFLTYVLTHRVFQDDLHMNQPDEMRSTISLSHGVFLFIFTVYTLTCGTMIFVYGHFLPTFGIYCNLHADTRQMTNMSLSFYVCAMFGRLFGTLSSLAVAQTVLINVCTTVGITVSVMLIYVSELGTTWLWIGTNILACVCSPVVSALETWALDVNRHRRILYGISSIADMAGYSVMSLLTGQLMAYFFVQMLHYVMTSVLLLQMVLIMFLYLSVYLNKRANSENEGYEYILSE